MRKYIVALAGAVLLLAVGCTKTESQAKDEGKKEAPVAAQPETSGPTTVDAAAPQPAAAPEVAAAPVVDVVELPPPAPEPLLQPTTLDASKPVRPSQLEKAFNPWLEQEIYVVGHPMFFFDEDVLRGTVTLNVDPTNKEQKLVRCDMKADDAETFSKTKAVVLKGIAKGYSTMWNAYEIRDCEKVAILDALPAKLDVLSATAPAADKPIPADQLVAVSNWADVPVLLEGSFNGSTTSDTGKNIYYRIDLYDPGEDMFTKRVSVYLKEACPEANYGTEKVWRIKGKLSGKSSFDKPEVVEAEFVEQVK